VKQKTKNKNKVMDGDSDRHTDLIIYIAFTSAYNVSVIITSNSLRAILLKKDLKLRSKRCNYSI